MGRKLIICCDGTWQQPELESDKQTIPTNVLKLTRALNPINSDDGCSQVVYYDAGIGTGNGWDKFVGGTFGVGLGANILQAYRFLATNYAEGDEIFCFGFSRGAYTVRSLTGLINTVGLLQKCDLDELHKAYKYYRTPPQKRKPDKFFRALELIKRTRTAQRMVNIKLLGVWDTVGALGVPTPMLGRISRRLWAGFHDTELCSNVEYAYQAVAIDEKRGPFRPDLWTSGGNAKEILQVWFAGCHSDIGGGSQGSGLSDICLHWMVELAEAQGLQFSESYLAEEVHPNAQGSMSDSFSMAYKFGEKVGFKPFVRQLKQPLYGIESNEPAVREFLHLSVQERWNQHPTYRPDNLSGDLLTSMPKYNRRTNKREVFSGVNGTIVMDDQTSHACEIIDFAKGSGVRVKALQAEKLVTGSEVNVKSNPTGELTGKVVWVSEHEAGIQQVG